MATFKYTVVSEDKQTKVETTDRDLAQQISMMLDGFKLVVVDPKGGIWKFSGLNAWAEAAEIIGE